MARAIALLLTASMLMGTLGVMPSPATIAGWFGVFSTERYPCEDCGCGCASAQECWTHCCCHSEVERLAWAIEQGVMPPEDVRFSDEKWLAAAALLLPGEAHCALCVDRIKDKVRKSIASPNTRRILVATQCSSCPAENTSECSHCGQSEKCKGSAKRTDGSRFAGASMSALSCKGVKGLVLVPLLPTLRSERVMPPEPVLGAEVVRVPDEMVNARGQLEAPEPPPRAV